MISNKNTRNLNKTMYFFQYYILTFGGFPTKHSFFFIFCMKKIYPSKQIHDIYAFYYYDTFFSVKKKQHDIENIVFVSFNIFSIFL